MNNWQETTAPTGAEMVSDKPMSRAMLSRNVRIHNRRTSVRLETAMWSALNEIASAENCSIHDLCGAVHDLKDERISFTAALRVFLMEYYRTVANVSPQVSSVQKLLKTPPRERISQRHTV